MHASQEDYGGYSVTDLTEIGSNKIKAIKNDTYVIRKLKKLN